MADETMLLLWGLFDIELYVEYEGNRSGSYYSVSGPIPLGRYRAFKRSAADDRADRIRSLADQLKLPIAALAGSTLQLEPLSLPSELPVQPFDAQAHKCHFVSAIAAKLAIDVDLAQPPARLAPADRAFIDQVLSETLNRRIVFDARAGLFPNQSIRRRPCGSRSCSTTG